MSDDVSGVLDALPGLICTGFPDGCIDFLNRRWRDYTGLDVEDSRGSGWQRAVHPDDLADLLACWRSFSESHERGEMEVEARLRRFDGEYRWFLFWTSVVSGPMGRAVKWCGVGIDIDARKRLEQAILASAQALHAHPWARPANGPALAAEPRDGNGAHFGQSAFPDGNGMPIILIAGCGDLPVAAQPTMMADAATSLRDEALLDAIRGALARTPSAMAEGAEMRALRERYISLSRREREVMALVVSGLLNKQVGGVLGISEITVKAHRGKVMRKMKAESLADLVTMGGRLGLRS